MPARGARRSGLIVLTWTIAVAALAVLAVAVAHYLGTSDSGMSGMAGMHGGSDVLARAGGDPAGPLLGKALLTKWQLNAVALAVLVLAAAWYLTAAALVPVREPGARWPVRHTLTFFAGLIVLGYATSGGIAVYDQVLFTAHMVGHLCLVMLGPALLMAGRPLTLMLQASTPRRRDRLARVDDRGGWATLARTTVADVAHELWRRREAFLDELDALPQVAQHGDPTPANLPGRDGDLLVALDWACLGYGAAGADLGLYLLPAREEFEPLLDAYLLGLPAGVATREEVTRAAQITAVYTALTRAEWALARVAGGEGALISKFRHPAVAPHLRALQRQFAAIEALLG